MQTINCAYETMCIFPSISKVKNLRNIPKNKSEHLQKASRWLIEPRDSKYAVGCSK